MKRTETASRTFKLGRLGRTYNARVPHMSALLTGHKPAPPPASVDHTRGMPSKLGMMLNDRLGDCACAAFYHAIQVWSFNAHGKMMTELDCDVERLYMLACGYNPRVPGEGPGGKEQDVLTYVLRHGAPMGRDRSVRHEIAGFVEVDPRIEDDVKHAIHSCGVAYIGFNVPQSIQPGDTFPAPVWEYVPAESNIIGGHAVILAGYDSRGAKVISWGQYYTMTWEFFAHFVDEVYAIADLDWVTATGKTPCGMTINELESQMQALREG